MTNTPEHISYIQLNDGLDPHPIDAVSIEGKLISDFQEAGKIVQTISASSTHDEIPSAKCIYELVYGSYTPPVHDYSKDYLTIEASEDGLTASLSVNTCEYCIDGDGNWKTLSAGTATESINSGHTLSFRGNLTPNSSKGIGTFTINKKCNLKGNCMSMLFGDNATNNYSLSGMDYAFFMLFYHCSNIVNVSSNFLPATTLASCCYLSMFQNCTSLTTAPKLPATTVTSNCYGYMFYGCSSLTSAPELPSTTLVNRCYYSMFRECSSLTTAPELPATTLANSCYESMFEGCKKLITAPELPATTLTTDCYYYMFRGCTSLTTAPELPATTLAQSCYSDMFNGCTSLTAAPELPATTLAGNCYGYMFSGCKKLTTAPELHATTLASNCYQSMFQNCASLTTAPELPATTLVDYCYQYMFRECSSLTTAPELPATTLANSCYESMFYNCKKLNYIKMLATNISASDCLNNWVNGVSSTGTFVKNAAMTSLPTGASGIPSGWTVEEYGGFSTEPLTFNILSDGTINWTASKTSIAKTIEYKLNDGEWTSITSNTGSSAPKIAVNPGDKIQFRGNNAQYATGFPVYNSFNGSTASFEVEGNIMSLIYGDEFKNKLTISSAYTFTGLFRECANLVSAENLILPATTLTNGCYLSMFRDCTKLTTVPELPATTLAQNCYSTMFKGCTSLTKVPSNLLPATTLADSCYADIFWNCTSLTTVPELPATTLADRCYNGMFNTCTSLTTVPSNLLPATTLSYYCYQSMFLRCTSLTTVPELPATQLAENCYENMFNGCTSLTTAPELPATTLVDSCYSNMFKGCTSLNYIKCLATDISARFCTDTWVNGVASTGTFVKASSMDNWSTSPYGIPTGWTVQNA